MSSSLSGSVLTVFTSIRLMNLNRRAQHSPRERQLIDGLVEFVQTRAIADVPGYQPRTVRKAHGAL